MLQKIANRVTKAYHRWIFVYFELIVVISVGITMLCYLTFVNPYKESFFSCKIYGLFHVYCPSCGMTRAFYNLIRGDVMQALNYNIFSILIFVFCVYFIIIYFIYRITGKMKLHKFFYNYKLWIVIVSILILFTIIRNINIYPLNLLAP